MDKLWKAKSGRPSTSETRRRTREFVRLVSAGVCLAQAQRDAGVAPTRALELLDDPAVFAVAAAARAEAA